MIGGPDSRASSHDALPAGIPATNIGPGSVGNTAFGYIANLASDAQAQLNAKLDLSVEVPVTEM